MKAVVTVRIDLGEGKVTKVDMREGVEDALMSMLVLIDNATLAPVEVIKVRVRDVDLD